jgi:hypothetical protein
VTRRRTRRRRRKGKRSALPLKSVTDISEIQLITPKFCYRTIVTKEAK